MAQFAKLRSKEDALSLRKALSFTNCSFIRFRAALLWTDTTLNENVKKYENPCIDTLNLDNFIRFYQCLTFKILLYIKKYI